MNKIKKTISQDAVSQSLKHVRIHSYIRIHVSAVADSVMLYLQKDFYNIIFKIKRKLYIALGSAPKANILGAHLCQYI
jgi:hypothetical protein